MRPGGLVGRTEGRRDHQLKGYVLYLPSVGSRIRYIHICICVYLCVCIYIYIYVGGMMMPQPWTRALLWDLTSGLPQPSQECYRKLQEYEGGVEREAFAEQRQALSWSHTHTHVQSHTSLSKIAKQQCFISVLYYPIYIYICTYGEGPIIRILLMKSIWHGQRHK